MEQCPEFAEVEQWLRFPCEDRDFVALGQIPKPPLEIGLTLGLSAADVDEVTRDAPQHRERTLKLLHLWRRRRGAEATWWELVQRLQGLRDAELLEKVKEAVKLRFASYLCKEGTRPAAGYDGSDKGWCSNRPASENLCSNV